MTDWLAHRLVHADLVVALFALVCTCCAIACVQAMLGPSSAPSSRWYHPLFWAGLAVLGLAMLTWAMATA